MNKVIRIGICGMLAAMGVLSSSCSKDANLVDISQSSISQRANLGHIALCGDVTATATLEASDLGFGVGQARSIKLGDQGVDVSGSEWSGRVYLRKVGSTSVGMAYVKWSVMSADADGHYRLQLAPSSGSSSLGGTTSTDRPIDKTHLSFEFLKGSDFTEPATGEEWYMAGIVGGGAVGSTVGMETFSSGGESDVPLVFPWTKVRVTRTDSGEISLGASVSMQVAGVVIKVKVTNDAKNTKNLGDYTYKFRSTVIDPRGSFNFAGGTVAEGVMPQWTFANPAATSTITYKTASGGGLYEQVLSGMDATAGSSSYAYVWGMIRSGSDLPSSDKCVTYIENGECIPRLLQSEGKGLRTYVQRTAPSVATSHLKVMDLTQYGVIYPKFITSSNIKTVTNNGRTSLIVGALGDYTSAGYTFYSYTGISSILAMANASSAHLVDPVTGVGAEGTWRVPSKEDWRVLIPFENGTSYTPTSYITPMDVTNAGVVRTNSREVMHLKADGSDTVTYTGQYITLRQFPKDLLGRYAGVTYAIRFETGNNNENRMAFRYAVCDKTGNLVIEYYKLGANHPEVTMTQVQSEDWWASLKGEPKRVIIPVTGWASFAGQAEGSSFGPSGKDGSILSSTSRDGSTCYKISFNSGRAYEISWSSNTSGHTVRLFSSAYSLLE